MELREHWNRVEVALAYPRSTSALLLQQAANAELILLPSELHLVRAVCARARKS